MATGTQISTAPLVKANAGRANLVQALVVEDPALSAAVMLLSRRPTNTYSDMFRMRRIPAIAMAISMANIQRKLR